MNDKNFEKINKKIGISIQQSTSVPNLSQFKELHFLGPNFPNEKNFEKMNIETVISIWQCTSPQNFSQLDEIHIMVPNLPKT